MKEEKSACHGKPGEMADGQHLQEETGKPSLKWAAPASGKRGFDNWGVRLETARLGEMIMQAHWETGPATPGWVRQARMKAVTREGGFSKSLLLQPTGASLARMEALLLVPALHRRGARRARQEKTRDS